MARRGRPRGPAKPKYTDEQAIQAALLYKTTNLSMTHVGRHFDVTPGTAERMADRGRCLLVARGEWDFHPRLHDDGCRSRRG